MQITRHCRLVFFASLAYAGLVSWGCAPLGGPSTAKPIADRNEATRESSASHAASLTLEDPGYFIATDGSLVAAAPGDYKIRYEGGPALRLVPDVEEADELLIGAEVLEHDEILDAPAAFAIVVDESEHHLVLLLPDGRGFEAAGFSSPVVPRGFGRAQPIRREAVRIQARFRRASLATRPAQTMQTRPQLRQPTRIVRPQGSRRAGSQRADALQSTARYRFTISAPGERSVWRNNFRYTIQWRLTYVSGIQRDLTADRPVDIDLETTAGRKVLDVFDGVASGTHAWTVPSDLAAGTYRLRITLPGRSRHSSVFRIEERVPLTVRIRSANDINQVWSVHQENGRTIRVLETPDLVPYQPPVETPQGLRAAEHDGITVISLSPRFLHHVEFIQHAPLGVGVLLPEPCSTHPFWPGKQRVPDYTILRETITLFDPPPMFYFERRGRFEQILRGPDGRLYIFVVFTPDDPGANSGWLAQAQHSPVLLQTAIASGYSLYTLAEFAGKEEPYSAPGG